MESLIEKRVARRQQNQVSPLSRNDQMAIHGLTEEDLRLHRIELGQNLDRGGEFVAGVGKQFADLVQDPLDLSCFAGDSCGQPIVELDHSKWFNERCGTPGGNIEQQSVDLGTSRGADGQAVAIAP